MEKATPGKQLEGSDAGMDVREHSAAAVTCALVLGMACVSCGTGEEYSVPKRVCGIPVQKEALAPLLPSGESVEEGSKESVTADTGCSISVDDKIALYVFQTYVDKFYDPTTDDVKSPVLTNPRQMRDLPSSGKGVIADDGAFVSTKCANERGDFLMVEIILEEGVNGSMEDRREDTVTFTKDIVSNIKKENGCVIH